MAQFIPGGRQGMRNNMYGVMNQETVSYIQSRINNISDMYGEAANSFVSNLRQDFDKGALRSISMARSNLEYTGTLFNEGIRRLRTEEDFRLASPMAQLYLRAQPSIRKDIYAGRLEGWDKEDPYPNLHGERNPYYQSVMEGALRYGDEEDVPVDDEFFRFYFTEDVPELEINEKLIVRQNWNRLYNLINREGEDIIDPTSIDGSYL